MGLKKFKNYNEAAICTASLYIKIQLQLKISNKVCRTVRNFQ